jgi:hypothetical protein
VSNAPRVTWRQVSVVTGKMIAETSMLPGHEPSPIMVHRVNTVPTDDGNGEVTIEYVLLYGPVTQEP